ncbi:MAG: zinc ribbon domain-containing protein [Pyrinomonadaceae bacterium]
MFCPQCGQERVSNDTNYCSRCGFWLSGTSELLRTGGQIPNLPAPTGYKAPSPRNRGLKQGLFIFLLTFLFVPVLAIISIAIRVQSPFIVAIAAVLLVMGGLLRMAYALMFESPVAGGMTLEDTLLSNAKTLLNTPANNQALPPPQSHPIPTYAAPATGHWRDTNDLEPRSVTEGTTKLLEHDETP